jgi:hypothetical protein
MPSDFIDLNAPRWDSRLPPPRGLLPVPPEVAEVVAREKARLQPWMDEAAEKRTRDDLTLQCYYEGQSVACRFTPEGVEVLAVGDEIRDLLSGLTQEELFQVTLKQP